MKTILQLGWAVVLAVLPPRPAFAEEQALRYREVVALSGKVEARMIPLDPDKTGPDAHREKRYFFTLDKPVAVATQENGDKAMNPDEKDVKVLQLMSGASPDRAIVLNAQLEDAVVKKLTIRITGTLFHSSNRQHYTPVLMEIADIASPTPVIVQPVTRATSPALGQTPAPPPEPEPEQ